MSMMAGHGSAFGQFRDQRMAATVPEPHHCLRQSCSGLQISAGGRIAPEQGEDVAEEDIEVVFLGPVRLGASVGKRATERPHRSDGKLNRRRCQPVRLHS